MRSFYALALAISLTLSAKFAEQASEAILLVQESGAVKDAAIRRTSAAIKTAESWRDGYDIIEKEARASNAITREAITTMEQINAQWKAVLKQCIDDGRRSE